jgi:hypothetical protein
MLQAYQQLRLGHYEHISSSLLGHHHLGSHVHISAYHPYYQGLRLISDQVAHFRQPWREIFQTQNNVPLSIPLN